MPTMFDFDLLEEEEATKKGAVIPSENDEKKQQELPVVEVGAPVVLWSFTEALHIFSDVRALHLVMFRGFEWCRRSEVGGTIRWRKGVWQDLHNEAWGHLLLHCLPPGEAILVRVIFELDDGQGLRASNFVEARTEPRPPGPRREDPSCCIAAAAGESPNGFVCCGWVEPTSGGAAAGGGKAAEGAGLTSLRRCLRCGDLFYNHCAAQDSPRVHPTFRVQTGELFAILIQPCLTANEKTSVESRRLCAFASGENVKVFEWDASQTFRRCLCKTRNPNDPPTFGWIKVRTKSYGSVCGPADRVSKEKQCYALAGMHSMDDRASSHLVHKRENKAASRATLLQSAPVVQRPAGARGLDLSDGRLLLRPSSGGPTAARATAPPAGGFQRVAVFGAHHTCTTALVRELERQFEVEVVNHHEGVDPEKRPDNHKHRVLPAPPKPEDALVICLIKDPYFWLQSLTRHGAIYALRPLARCETTGGWTDLVSAGGVFGLSDDMTQERLLDLILGPVEFFGDIYQDGALGVWEATVRSYFDEIAFPRSRTAVLRSEDFLFSFASAVDALEALGLRRRPKAPPPMRKPVKGGPQHPHTRGREEALAWYSEPVHRLIGFSQRQAEAVADTLPQELLEPLGYGDNAVASWVSGFNLEYSLPRWPANHGQPFDLCVAGCWRDFRPVDMVWEAGAFACWVEIGASGVGFFQLWVNGDHDFAFYPNKRDSSCYERSWSLLGPDGDGYGLNFQIGKPGWEKASAGDCFVISAVVDESGMGLKRVSWSHY